MGRLRKKERDIKSLFVVRERERSVRVRAGIKGRMSSERVV